jgi:hypothetical protein
MAASLNYASTPTRGAALISVGDTSRVAPTGAKAIFSPAGTLGVNAGGWCERIVIMPVGPTTTSVLRFWLVDGLGGYHLYDEEPLAASNIAPGVQMKSATLQAVDNPNIMPINIPAGWSMAVSVNDTQLSSDYVVNSIAASQTSVSAGPLTLNGASVTAANATAIAVAQTLTANATMTLTSTPVTLTTPALISLTSLANLSGNTVKIVGRTAAGQVVNEALAGPNNNTVFSVNAFVSVMEEIPSLSSGSTMWSGYSTVAGTAVLPLPSQVMLTSGGNLAPVNFTIYGMATNGSVLTETLAGPNVGSVFSANTYAAVFGIFASAAVSSAIMVGNAPIFSGVSVTAEGGSF